MRDNHDDVSTTCVQSDADHVAALESREAVDRVSTILDGLPENQQEVIRLKFQNGLSYREISHVTQLSVSNVGYLIHIAIKKIRKQLVIE